MALSREYRALRKSYSVFMKAVDPDTAIAVLYSGFLLTPEEKRRAKQSGLLSHEQLDMIFQCLEKRVLFFPSVFHRLVQILLDEPALEVVGKEMKARYVEEQSQGDTLCASPQTCVQLPLAPSTSITLHSPPHETSLPPSTSNNQPSPPHSPSQHVQLSSPLSPPKAEATHSQDLSGQHGAAADKFDLNTSDRYQAIIDEASALQYRFVGILAHTRIEFSRKPVGLLEELRVTLLTLPESSRFRHLIFLRKEREHIMNAGIVDEIFDILEEYWDYSDYTLLQYLVNQYGGDALKKEMSEYVTALELFEKRTTIQEDQNARFNHKYPSRYVYNDHNLSTVSLQLAKDPKVRTLYDARQLEESLAKQACLEPYVLRLKKVVPS